MRHTLSQGPRLTLTLTPTSGVMHGERRGDLLGAEPGPGPGRPWRAGVQRVHGLGGASRSLPRNLGIRALHAVGHTKIGTPLRWVSCKPNRASQSEVITG